MRYIVSPDKKPVKRRRLIETESESSFDSSDSETDSEVIPEELVYDLYEDSFVDPSDSDSVPEHDFDVSASYMKYIVLIIILVLSIYLTTLPF